MSIIPNTDYAQKVKNTHTKLKTNALNFWEVTAQSIALISPSMTACLIIPLMFATAGSMGWFCFLFGTIMLLFVAIGLNQFAKRFTAAGSMYEYTVKGLGPKIGGMSGWSLIFAYMFIGIAGVTGFTHFASLLLTQAGATGMLSHPSITLFLICMVSAWFLAYRDITLSTILMLAAETISVAVILVLCLFALGKTGIKDTTQLHPFAAYQGFKSILTPLGLGVGVAVFSGVGFEAATAFGEEAKKPLTTIPRAVIASLILTGAFFIFTTYVETRALATNNPTLDQLTAPLVTLSDNLGVHWMGIVTSLGAMISFFALAMSCLNSGSRILFTMGRYGIFPISIGSSHKHNLTPHVAITVFAAIQFLIPAFVMFLTYVGASGVMVIAAPIDVFNDAGLLGAMGFCCAYVLISIAAPIYLYKIGELKPAHVIVAVIALLLLLVPIIAPFWPNPAPYPTNYFPYGVAAYLAIGAIWMFIRSKTTSEMESVRQVLDQHARELDPLPPEGIAELPAAGEVAMA